MPAEDEVMARTKDEWTAFDSRSTKDMTHAYSVLNGRHQTLARLRVPGFEYPLSASSNLRGHRKKAPEAAVAR
jgi:hypothetical protein